VIFVVAKSNIHFESTTTMSTPKRQKKPYKRGAKTVGHYLSNITRPVFEKFGFQKAALLTEWASIIGEPLCHFTAPEQIKWQNQTSETINVEQFGQRQGAVLVIRVEGPAALEVQHQAPQIIERINTYFGFAAIGEIRILQAPLQTAAQQKEIKRYNLDKPVAKEASIENMDDRMENAFQRLWRGIQTRKKASTSQK